MSSKAPDLARLADLERRAHRGGALDIHPYFGKLEPALALALIETFSKPGDTVLDPFCGSGTVLHEGLLAGRSVLGWDSSPLAVLIASAKVIGADDADVVALKKLAQTAEPFGARYGIVRTEVPRAAAIPEMPRARSVALWFEENALDELAWARDAVAQAVLSPSARLLALTAFSRVVTRASNQQGESSYRRVSKSHSPGAVIDLFVESLGLVADAAWQFGRLVGGDRRRSGIAIEPSERSFVQWGPVAAQVERHDARDTLSDERDERASLVVTSPPYLMAWDYGLYHRFRFYWLGYDVDSYEETEIGRHLRRQGDDVSRYCADMRSAFLALADAVAGDGRLCLVNAPSVVYGREVDTNLLLREVGAEAGWECEQIVKSVDIPGPHHGMYASLGPRGARAPGASGKREHVVFFKRA